MAIMDLDQGAGWLYHDLDGVDVFTIEPDEDPAKEVERFLKAATIKRGDPAKYRSIAIDTISSMRGRHLMHLVGDSLFIEIGDYGVATNWLRRVLYMTKHADQIICWISHMKEERDGSRLVIRPSGLSEAGLNACEEMLDAIVYMGKTVGRGGDVARFLTTEELDPINGRAGVLAKDRTGFLPDTMELDDIDEDGTPPEMFMPFFEEVVKELGYHRPPKKKTKPKAKKKATKKK
jgi:hypothetical protein